MIGITGAKTEVGKSLIKLGCIPLVCDVTIPEEIEKARKKVHPDLVIHCAELGEEASQKDYKLACKINVNGAYNVFQAFSVPIILISTALVFEGKKWFWKSGYKEKDYQSPANLYGFSKFGGEAIAMSYDHVKIIRLMPIISYNEARSILNFANRFNEMPKILHVADRQAIFINGKKIVLNTSLAKKLGIL